MEEVPVPSAKPVVPGREGRLQPMHAGGQIRLGCFQGEVIVVGHDDIRMNPPAESPRSLVQASLKRPTCALRRKNRVPKIAAVDDVIPGVRKLET